MTLPPLAISATGAKTAPSHAAVCTFWSSGAVMFRRPPQAFIIATDRFAYASSPEPDSTLQIKDRSHPVRGSFHFSTANVAAQRLEQR